MMAVSGIVSDIQRYSLHDGPGIRTVVFLKGCPLSCLWCANPESQPTTPQLMITAKPCIACEDCVRVCPQSAVSMDTGNPGQPEPIVDWSLCDLCLKCVEVCLPGTLTRVGEILSVAEVIDAITLDMPFYVRSGGGMTLSGGEPTKQAEFSSSILTNCQLQGIHTAIETCGYCTWERLEQLHPHCDLIYFDLKHLDADLHREFTGQSNKIILENFERLVKVHPNVIVRLPLVPGYNDDDEHLLHLTSYLASIQADLKVELIPYHKLGRSKYERLGLEFLLPDIPTVDDGQLAERQRFLQTHGLYLKCD